MPILCFDEGVLPAPPAERLTRLDEWLSRTFDHPVALPAGWKQHVLRWHGGAPRGDHRCFVEPGGRVRAICRMLNILTLDDWEPGAAQPSWRKRHDDIALDFSIDAMLNASQFMERLAETPSKQLVPFAALDHAGHDPRGMMEFDLLCFDVTSDGEPPIVTWSFESSWRDPAATIRVAASWDELQSAIRDDVRDPCREPASPDWQ